MVSYKLSQNTEITNTEKTILENAKKLPLVFDEDSPALTEDMEKAFIEARKKNPYTAEPLTVYVSPVTIQKAKSLSGNYIELLGHLLDKAVNEYVS